MGVKPLRIRFDEVDGIIKIYDGSRCFVLLGPRIYNAIYDRIDYLVWEKSDAKCIILQESELIHVILYI